MPGDLKPAMSEELIEALSRGLRYEGRQRVGQADTYMAQMTADYLVEHLLRNGSVLMKKPGAAAPAASHMLPPPRGA